MLRNIEEKRVQKVFIFNKMYIIWFVEVRSMLRFLWKLSLFYRTVRLGHTIEPRSHIAPQISKIIPCFFFKSLLILKKIFSSSYTEIADTSRSSFSVLFRSLETAQIRCAINKIFVIELLFKTYIRWIVIYGIIASNSKKIKLTRI